MVESIIQSFDIWIDAQGVKSKGRVKSVENISLEGVAKLRQLILELAVCGKLVPQDPNDEPACELLKRIEKEKERLIKAGKLKKAAIKQNDNKSSKIVPYNWVVVKLSEVFDVRDGTHDSPKSKLNGYPLVTSKNLSSGKLNLSDVNYISIEDHLKIIERSKVDKGDVLFAMIGSIGNPVIVDTETEFSIKNVALFKYYNKELSSGSYLQLFLKIAAVEMKAIALGGVQSFVSLGLLRDFKFPLPPLAEQNRIVAKVDELMTLCDKFEEQQANNLKTHQLLVKTILETLTQAADTNELQAAWERMSTHFDTLFCTEDSIDQLKQIILKLAIEGKLVAQDPNDEPACELLKKIEKEKERLIKQGGIKKATPQKNDYKSSIVLPFNWELVRLSEVFDVRDGTHDSPKPKPNGYPLVTSKNLSTGKLDLTDVNYISEEDHLNIIKRSKVDKGDILFAMIGSIGNPVIVETEIEFSIKNVALFKYYNKEFSSEGYLQLFLKFAAIEMKAKALGGVQSFVSLGLLRDFKIPLPPLKEQQRIVAKVNELFSVCDSLKEKILKAEEIKVQLAEAVVEGATA